MSASADSVNESKAAPAGHDGGRPDGEENAGASAGSSRWKTVGYVLGAVVVLGLLFVAGRQLGGYVDAFTAWVEGLGFWAPLVFILGYAVGTVAFAPGSLLTLASGAIFGLFWGTVYAWTGASLGACAAFLVARYLARGWVESKIEGKPRFQSLDGSIGRDGGKIVALLRLAPIFPFVLLNYALGLTKVRFVHYALACFAMAPGTLLYVYYGHIGKALLSGEKTVWDWVLQIAGLLAVVLVTVIITKKARAALAAETRLEAEEATDE